MDFFTIAQNVDFTPFLSVYQHTGETEIRGEDGPSADWMVNGVGRLMVLDLMRRVEGVSLGRILIAEVAPGVTQHVLPDEGYSCYVGVLREMSGGWLKIERGDAQYPLRTGDVVSCGPLTFSFKNEGNGPALLLVVNIGQDY